MNNQETPHPSIKLEDNTSQTLEEIKAAEKQTVENLLDHLLKNVPLTQEELDEIVAATEK